MMKVLLSLFVATAALANTADLAVSLEAPDAVPVEQPFAVIGTVTNLGPDVARRVLVSLGSAGTTICLENDVIGDLQPGERRAFQCEMRIPRGLYAVRPSIHASTSDDSNYENNYAEKYIPAISNADLFIHGSALDVAKPAQSFRMQVVYGNISFGSATNVTVTITAPTNILEAPANCTTNGNRAVCSIGSLVRHPPPDDSWYGLLNFIVAAPDQSAAQLDIIAEIDADQSDERPEDDRFVITAHTYRTFFVTTTADDGSGSLRAAIDGANAECADAIPCLIAFRIPAAAGGWHTIALTSPLPRILGRVILDGGTQREYIADTNTAGPEIEISGSALAEGNGLEIGCDATVRELVINGFPSNGVVAEADASCTQSLLRHLDANYIGTDPTGTRAVPNARGVWIAASRWSVTNNVISGNTYSGVYVARGQTYVNGNKIGVDPEIRPLGNGGSGVYISQNASGSDVSNNYIGFNHHYGVAIDANAQYVSAQSNSLQANWGMGIDWGHDSVITGTPVPLPDIHSVRFENGVTIIEGTTTAYGTFSPRVTLYANDAPDPSGYGEGQYVLGTVAAEYGGYNSAMTFKFVWPGELRGKWVTATVTHQYYIGWLRAFDDTGWGYYTTTSEFSRAYEVQ